MNTSIRLAKSSDLEVINTIYNQAVANGYQTADLAPITMAQRQNWFEAHDDDRYMIHVLEDHGKVIGWSSLSKYREGRPALQSTAEVSYYLDQDHLRKGHGADILKQTIHIAKNAKFNNLVAILLSSNKASIKLLEKFEFKEWGRIPDSAKINNKWVDHLYYGRKI